MAKRLAGHVALGRIGYGHQIWPLCVIQVQFKVNFEPGVLIYGHFVVAFALD